MTLPTAAKIAVLSMLIIAAAATAMFFPVGEWIERLMNWVRTLGIWGPVLLIAVYVPACVLFVPGSWLTIAAGYAFGTPVGAASALVGSVLGASATFMLSRTLAREAVERRIATSRRFRALDRGVADEAFKIVLLTRLSPVLPFNVLNYAFGITQIRFRDFFLASWLGMLPGGVLYAYLGSVAHELTGVATGKSDRRPAEWAFLVAGLVATVAVTVVIARIARRALREDVPEVEA